MSLISVENAIIIFCLWFDWSAPLMQKPFTVMLVIHPVFNNQWLCPHGYQHIINSQHCKECKSLTKRWGRSCTDVRYNQNLIFPKNLGTSVKFDLVSVSYLSLSCAWACVWACTRACVAKKHSLGCQLLEKYPENTQKIINEAFLYLVFVEIIFFPYNTFYC